MGKVSVVASDIEEKIRPLYKKPNMSKSHEEKESLKRKIKTTEKDLEKAKKTVLTEIVKAYELFCLYFVGEAHTQWDKVVQEIDQKDPWVAVNGVFNKRPRKRTWEYFLDCIELHKLTIFYYDAAELQRYYMQQHVRKLQCITVQAFVTFAWAFSTTTWLIHPRARTAPWLLKI